MPTQNNPSDQAPKNSPDTTTPQKGASEPKKPGNDPDQTPDREVKETPKAKPESTEAPGKTKPGF